MKDLMHTFFSMVRRVWRPAMTLGLTLAAFTRCVEWSQPTNTDAPGVARYVSAVQTVAGDASAVLRTGAVPAAGSGPVVTAQIPGLVLLGGTTEVTASAATPFRKILVTVPGVTDYWELTLPVETTREQVLIVFGQEIPKTRFELFLAGGRGSELNQEGRWQMADGRKGQRL